MKHNDWSSLVEGIIYLGIGAVSLTTYILERKEEKILTKLNNDENKKRINVFEEPSTVDFH